MAVIDQPRPPTLRSEPEQFLVDNGQTADIMNRHTHLFPNGMMLTPTCTAGPRLPDMTRWPFM